MEKLSCLSSRLLSCQERPTRSTTTTSSNNYWPVFQRICVLSLLLLATTYTPTRLATTVQSWWSPAPTSSSSPIEIGSSFHLRAGNNNEAPNNILSSAAALGGSVRFLQDANATNNNEEGDEIGSDEATAYPPEFCDVHCPPPSENSWISAVPFGVQIIMIIFLISMSALFSGLTLGLMGLDKTGLEIVMEGDDPVNAANARVIYSVRKNGNLLLCTLLLGNVAVNAMLSILLADKAGGAVGFISSTFLIVIFGEILPQALCSRYALAIGSKTVPLVKVIMVLVWPIAFPLAFALDKALGDELATTYSGAEMLKLLQIHVQEEVLDKETAVTMTGALKYKDMTVSEVMTPLQNTFMLSVDEKLNFETIATIFKTGYSRIPVYEVSKNNIIGLLFVKDLIFIDPEDETPIRNFVQIFGRNVHVVWPVDKLGDVLRELKEGRSHMALVRDVVSDGDCDPYYEIKGIITLEDIIEEILGHEIVDETDAFVDGSHQVKVDRTEGFEWAKIRLLGSRIVAEKLSYTETQAITAHLLANYPQAVELLTENQVQHLVAETVVTVFPTATRELGKPLPNDLIYEKGVSSDVCTLILSGRMTVITGADDFRTDVSSWTLLGISALRDPLYKADFTAFVCNGPCRCLQFTRDSFAEALDASVSERHAIQDDSFRSLAVDKPKVNGSGVGSEGASEYSETTENVSERGGRMKGDRRSKLIAALQIARDSGPETVPPKTQVKSVVGFGPGPPDLSSSSANFTENTVPDVQPKSDNAEASARVSIAEDGDKDMTVTAETGADVAKNEDEAANEPKESTGDTASAPKSI